MERGSVERFPKYKRNRVRHELVPIMADLAGGMGPLAQRLETMSKQSSAYRDWLGAAALAWEVEYVPKAARIVHGTVASRALTTYLVARADRGYPSLHRTVATSFAFQCGRVATLRSNGARPFAAFRA